MYIAKLQKWEAQKYNTKGKTVFVITGAELEKSLKKITQCYGYSIGEDVPQHTTATDPYNSQIY